MSTSLTACLLGSVSSHPPRLTPDNATTVSKRGRQRSSVKVIQTWLTGQPAYSFGGINAAKLQWQLLPTHSHSLAKKAVEDTPDCFHKSGCSIPLEKAKNKPQRMTFESSVLLQYWGKNIFSKSPEHSLKATVSHCVWGARTDCFDGRLLRLTRQLKYTEFVLLLVVLRQQCWWKLATIHGSTPSIKYYCDE